MKTYISNKYWGKETIDIDYDTINNHPIESKKYFYLENKPESPLLLATEVSSYFIANEEHGVGLCTVDSDGVSNTTYYEDEEWCELFTGLSTEDKYYDDFSKLEDIKNVINYNITMINQKKEVGKILSEIPEVKIRDFNNNIIAIAKECYVVKNNENSFNLILNKIITNRLSKINPDSITIEIDGLNYLIWKKYYDNSYDILDEEGIIIFYTKEYNNPYSTTISDVTNDNDISIDYNYDDSELNLEYVDLLSLLNDKKTKYDRKKEIEEFDKHYNYVFKREIDIAKFLLS